MSMVVCIVAQAAIYMAADSRQYPSGADTVQKVFLLGRDGMMGHSGIGVIPYDDNSGRWDAADEVGKIASRTPDGTIQEQLAFLTKEVLASLNAGLLKRSAEISGDHPQLAIMLVKLSSKSGAACAHQAFTIVSTPLANNRWRHRAIADASEPLHTPAQNGVNSAGIWFETPPECPVGARRPAAPTYAAISAFIMSVAGQSDYCRQMIGGPIRVAVSDENGARWMYP